MYFDPFFGIVAFLESYAMREIEGLSLFSYAPPFLGLCCGYSQTPEENSKYATELALSKNLKSFGFEELTGAEGSVKRQDFLLRDNMRTAEETALRTIFRGVNRRLFS